MNVLLFGATGMVGKGVLRECLVDPSVHLVKTVGRTATGVQQTKLREVVHDDLWDYSSIEMELSGFDACFFCLGVSELLRSPGFPTGMRNMPEPMWGRLPACPTSAQAYSSTSGGRSLVGGNEGGRL